MKKTLSIFLAWLLAAQIIEAQGIIYISNLSQKPLSNQEVGSDSWLAFGFLTGTNAGGYVLDSVQLELARALGSPNGFSAMIYSGISTKSSGNNLSTLAGSLNPATSGIYNYTTASSLTLLPLTTYYVVLTAATSVTTGGYEWSYASNYSYGGINGWQAPPRAGSGNIYESADGLNWNFDNSGGPFQFAITATPVPEPSACVLAAIGPIILFYRRRKQFK
jgi:hypothetical protein